MSEIVKYDPQVVAAVINSEGDLSKLDNEARVQHYSRVCDAVGLHASTQPFQYITLNRKLVLYAKKDATDQLRQIHGVSTRVVSKEEVDGLYIVTVGAVDRAGRQDEDVGAVQIKGLVGDARANAMMKAITKAKRRVTLSICGLGMLSDVEVDDVHNAQPPKHDLAALFPGEKPEPEKTEPLTAPVSADSDTPGGVVDPPEATIAPAAPQGDLEAYALVYPENLDSVVTEFHPTSATWAKAYSKMLNSIADGGKDGKMFGTYAERRSLLKQFEADNLETLNLGQKAGRDQLIQARLKLNKTLSAKAKDEQNA